MDDSYEPTPADLDFLNKLDQGYVGLTKPRVVIVHDRQLYEGSRLPASLLEIEDGDHLRIDEEELGRD